MTETPTASRSRRVPGRAEHSAVTRWTLGVSAVVAVIALWESLTRVGVVDPNVIPSAGAVLGAWGEAVSGANYWTDLWATLSGALAGLAIAVAIGSVASFLIGLIRSVEESTFFVIEFLKPIPPIALIPLGLLLWGPAPTMKISLVAFGALWPFLTQMLYGLRQTNGVALEMARSYRLGWYLTLKCVHLPSLTPFALTGARISASLAVIVAVVVELVGGAAGLGQTITVAQANGLLPVMYAYILTAGVLGMAINLIFRAAERSLLFWHPSQRSEAT
ncbi:ABC transporter permease [Spiractinospora alimapuensis]|uniref:ABC transporter permease n=1 Tax=Spiractinospora alimapuensis TaxID=2820884 RepID=UPI001F37B327|nr:ABC transporter permease [Spiractinospora alimapuensis]QVQ51212.1 ABC transporter permease [Spiractinospora alimapuensis]